MDWYYKWIASIKHQASHHNKTMYHMQLDVLMYHMQLDACTEVSFVIVLSHPDILQFYVVDCLWF